jgi:hypothetical protein
MHGEFDYPYPLPPEQEAEVERLAAQRERKRKIAEVKAWARLVVRALGTKDEKPAWGLVVKQAVIQAFRLSLPSAAPMDVDRFEDTLREIAGGNALQSGRAAGVLFDDKPKLSALEHGVRVVHTARAKGAR